MNNTIDAYIRALSADKNAPKVVTDEAALVAYVGENYSRVAAEKPLAILYPATTEQVQRLVELAGEHGVSLIVRSSSGFATMNGSSLPAAGTACVAVNLSKMNKIRHIDPKNNMAIIEAGVTFSQLNEALKPYGLYVEHPLSPRAEKSVVASFLDREPVMTAKHLWDVPDPLCCVEMIMGNGALFRSGSAAGPGTIEEMLESGCAINTAQGPVWLDLGRVVTGAQGTLAIVTWASVKVRPIGSVRELTFVQDNDVNKLTEYASQIIRQRLGENVVLLNRKGLANVLTVPERTVANMPKWTLITDVRGFRFFPERYLGNQLADMADIAKACGVTILKDLADIDNSRVWDALDNASVEGAPWRLHNGREICDLFFLDTMDRIETLTTMAEKAVASVGLDKDALCVYVQPSQMGRNCHIEFIIKADKAAADRLEDTLGCALLDAKAFFSRPYGRLVKPIYARYPGQTTYMPKMKAFFDEKQILNPGRLVYDGGRN